MFKPWKGHLEWEQPYLGDVLSMLINYLLTGMILQAPHPATVDKQSIQVYEGANANLHEVHCYWLGGWFTQSMLLL